MPTLNNKLFILTENANLKGLAFFISLKMIFRVELQRKHTSPCRTENAKFFKI